MSTVSTQSTCTPLLSAWERIVRAVRGPRMQLVPYCPGMEGCPRLSVGDTLIAVLDNEALDYIAGLCGMNMRIKKGGRTKWKVKELLPDGDALCISDSNRILLKYLTWSDGNLVTLKATLARSEMQIRFYLRSRAVARASAPSADRIPHSPNP